MFYLSELIATLGTVKYERLSASGARCPRGEALAPRRWQVLTSDEPLLPHRTLPLVYNSRIGMRSPIKQSTPMWLYYHRPTSLEVPLLVF